VLWGLARSARAEHPHLGLTLLDLDPGLGDADAADQQHHSVARPPGMPLRDAQLHCA